MSVIEITDLASPVISEEGQKVLAQRAAIPVELSMDGVIAFTEPQLDVPLIRDEAFLDGIERFLVEGHSHKDGFSEAGKTFMVATMSSLLLHRSRLEAMFKNHPEIADVELRSPIVIAGLPRSGTTHLSNIISSDSRINSLSLWEGYRPFPSIDVMNGAEDKDDRAAIIKQFLDDMLAVVPHYKTMIDVPYDGTTEELHLLHLAGTPVGHYGHAVVPNYQHWFWHEMDPLPMYDCLKRSLQAIQWLRGNSKRWILKTPHHLAFLPIAEQVFDDPVFVILHRDPASSAISYGTMQSYVFRETYEKPDVDASFASAMTMVHHMSEGVTRDIDSLDPSRVHQVFFHNYMQDTMQTLRGIYRVANLEWTAQAESELQAYIDSHPRGRHGGRLVYNPERDFGMTREQIREKFSFYTDKFPIRIEDEHG